MNLEEPTVIWQHQDTGLAGIDTTDRDLDVWVLADRSWRWKDEHELVERAAFGDEYWVPEPVKVWDEGRRMIALLDARAYPFDGTWCDFEPDPAWIWPETLPAGWDRPRAR